MIGSPCQSERTKQFHLCDSCVNTCQLVHALPSSSIFITIHRHMCMSICFDYSVMTTYNLYAPIIIYLCVLAPRDFTRCLHTCDHMCRGLYFTVHPCLCFLWIHSCHAHINKNQVCVTPPICVFFNNVFIRIYSIQLNTCTRVHVYTKTIQPT